MLAGKVLTVRVECGCYELEVYELYVYELGVSCIAILCQVMMHSVLYALICISIRLFHSIRSIQTLEKIFKQKNPFSFSSLDRI